MKKLIDVLVDKGYYFKIEGQRIEIPFSEYDCSIVVVNNQYKVYTFEKNSSNIIAESKWYKRQSYVLKYIINNSYFNLF